MSASFLDRTVHEILDIFAAGKTTPGAGSAAALAGALAGSLIQSVARYTVQDADKRGDEPLRDRARAIFGEAEKYCERLRGAVDEDAAAFERYWKEGRAGEDLGRATAIPIEIASDCLALAELGSELVDRGFRNSRAEAATAALSALANGEAALEIVRLNLKVAGDAPWAGEISEEIRRLSARLAEVREAVAARR